GGLRRDHGLCRPVHARDDRGRAGRAPAAADRTRRRYPQRRAPGRGRARHRPARQHRVAAARCRRPGPAPPAAAHHPCRHPLPDRRHRHPHYERLSDMSLSRYGEFLAFAIVLILIPGPNFGVVTKNTLVGGRRRGSWTALGIATANLLQGTAAATGLSAIVLRAEPVFQAIKWAGVAYLAFLGVQAIRSAVRGQYAPLDADQPSSAMALSSWRQGFLSNITNPKILVFYLAVLPQFLTPGTSLGWVLLFAWTHAVVGLAYLLALVTGLHGLRSVLLR